MTCRWTENLDGAWDTDCGNAFEFNSYGPARNGFSFCPYCGAVLEEHAWTEDAEP